MGGFTFEEVVVLAILAYIVLKIMLKLFWIVVVEPIQEYFRIRKRAEGLRQRMLDDNDDYGKDYG